MIYWSLLVEHFLIAEFSLNHMGHCRYLLDLLFNLPPFSANYSSKYDSMATHPPPSQGHTFLPHARFLSISLLSLLVWQNCKSLI